MELSKLLPIFAPSFGEKDDNIEESYEALTRQRICKIQSIRVKSLKAASPAVAYILLTPIVESAHIYTCRCELIFILTYTGIAEPSG